MNRKTKNRLPYSSPMAEIFDLKALGHSLANTASPLAADTEYFEDGDNQDEY